MKVLNKPDFSRDDATCKSMTGKTMDEWFAELDKMDGLKLGRRNSVQAIYETTKDAWWATTLYVEYEKKNDVKKKDGLYEGFSICVTKTISAPVDKVYQTWIDGANFAQMFGDNGQQDVKEGGSISCDAGCKGTFTRVRENKDLRFSWEHPGCSAPMTVDVMFQDNKGKTLMNVMTSRIQTREEADGLRDAWAQFLNALKAKSEA